MSGVRLGWFLSCWARAARDISIEYIRLQKLNPNGAVVKPLDRDVRFGRRLKQRRNDAGLKQVDLVSRLNRPQAYVSKY